MQNVTLSPGQSVVVTYEPEDAAGRPGSVTTVPTWTPSNGTATPVTVADGGMSATVGPCPTVGVFDITISESSESFGANPFTTTFSVTVQENPATQGVVTFGTPTP